PLLHRGLRHVLVKELAQVLGDGQVVASGSSGKLAIDVIVQVPDLDGLGHGRRPNATLHVCMRYCKSTAPCAGVRNVPCAPHVERSSSRQLWMAAGSVA